MELWQGVDIETKTPSARWVPLLAIAMLMMGVALAINRGSGLAPGVFANAPSGSVAVARVDIGAVLGSSLWRHFVTARNADEGLVRIRERCGFDPVSQIDDVLVFVTGNDPSSLDHVVFAARGPFDHDALGECMGDVVRSQGGGLRRTEVEGLPAVAGREGDSRIAFLGSTGAVFGTEEAVVDVIRTARGEVAPLQDDELRALWDRVATRRDIAVAARLPDHWRAAIASRVSRAAQGVVELLIGDLRAFGAGVRVRRGFAFGLALHYGESEHARAVEALIVERRDNLLESVMVSLSPAGPALRRLGVETRGRELIVAIDLSQQQVDRLLELADRLQRDPDALARILEGL